VMGATYDEATHSYTTGLILLCITAVIALLFTIVLARRQPQR
jgi:MFS transporter, NNP family, nitrate/nitrite transporter